MLEYTLQSVVTSFISIALIMMIMMMMIGTKSSVLPRRSVPK